MASTPIPMQMTAESATAESDFSQQLQNLMVSLEAGSEGDTKTGVTEEEPDKTPERDKKEEPLLPPAILAIFADILPARLPGSFGLPSAGDEPLHGLIPVDTAPVNIVDMAAKIEIDAPAPPPKESVDPNVELAFAVRLTGLINSHEPKPVNEVINAIQQSSEPEPIRISNQEQRPLIPANPGAGWIPQQGTSNPDSLLSDGNAPEQKPAESAPQRQRTENSSSETAGAEPPDHAASIAADDTAPRTAVLQTSNPAPIAMASSTIASHSSAAPSSIDTASANPLRPADPAHALRQSSTSEVTEISVMVPVSRPDSASEERVAIHMVQRGTEVHVSVRTPDSEVAQSLRQDLTKLASSLDDAGFRTETWRPAAAIVAGASSTNTQRDTARETHHGHTAAEDGRPGGNNGREPGEQRRRQQDERPRWVAELEQHTNP